MRLPPFRYTHADCAAAVSIKPAGSPDHWPRHSGYLGGRVSCGNSQTLPRKPAVVPVCSEHGPTRRFPLRPYYRYRAEYCWSTTSAPPESLSPPAQPLCVAEPTARFSQRFSCWFKAREPRCARFDLHATLGYSLSVASGLTYRKAGVDMDAAERFVSRVKRMSKHARRPEVLSGVGLFAAAVRLPTGYRQPVLLNSADGVGTKLLVAQLAGRHDTVGIDLVAMNANDILTSGAEPFVFLDYIAAGDLSRIDADAIVGGIVTGCRRAGMALVGGETAEMPGLYTGSDYDLAGFAVGVAERGRVLDGTKVRTGDVVIGLESSGLHSNGFSLARRALRLTPGSRRRPSAGERDLLEKLLTPTHIYVKPVLAALKSFRIHAMAHITGGGLVGNLPRVLPPGAEAVIDRSAMPEPDIFREIRNAGRIEQSEMDRTFNCGIGYVLVVDKRDADKTRTFLRRRRTRARIIGSIKRGRRGVRYTG